MDSDRTDSLPKFERTTLIALAALTVVLRVIAYFCFRFDSDEPQHLHVAWGWTAGYVQYRDYFDNHAPLFHMLSAPLLKVLGERADILLYMRAAMLPLFAIVLVCTWIIARRFYSQRAALWSTMMLALLPSFFLKSIEYRTDNLWNTVWMVALLVLTGGPATALRIFATGAILGVAGCVSLKTVLLAACLGMTALATRFALRERFRPATLVGHTGAFLAGLAIAPAATAALFAHLHALPNLIYCVFTFNRLVAHTHAHVLPLRIAYPFMLGIVVWYGRRIGTAPHPPSRGEESSAAPDAAARTRFFLGMFLAIYSVTLAGVWVLISPRDLLPIMPIAAIALCGWLVERTSNIKKQVLWFGAVAMIFAVVIVYETRWFQFGPAEDITMMNQVLHLTRPGEPIMDLKGETIYRRRPYYFIFEKITRDAMHAGLLPDHVAESVVKARCYVVQADGPFFPIRSRLFLNEHFMDMGRLRAAGQWVKLDGSFSIAIPGEYVLLDKDGETAGMLDGTPYSGRRLLAAGRHRFVPVTHRRVAVLWAPAFERGFSPFHLKDRDF